MQIRGCRNCRSHLQLRNCFYPLTECTTVCNCKPIDYCRALASPWAAQWPPLLPSSFTRGFLSFFDPKGVPLPFSALHTLPGQENISTPHLPPKKSLFTSRERPLSCTGIPSFVSLEDNGKKPPPPHKLLVSVKSPTIMVCPSFSRPFLCHGAFH